MRTEFFFRGGDSRKCFRKCRHKNLQGTKFDHFNIKSLKARCIEFIDKDVFTAFTYLGLILNIKQTNIFKHFPKFIF